VDERNRGSREATILFFTPPSTSYELRCEVEIHEDDEVWEYTNSVHDTFHRTEKPRDWKKTPAYLFKIKEIYDNGGRAMGGEDLLRAKSFYPFIS